MESTILVIEQNSELTDLLDGMRHNHLLSKITPRQLDVQKIMEESIKAIIINDDSSGVKSIEMCRNIRAGKIRSPIMIIAETYDEINAVLSFEVGADDFIAKPLNKREFIARVNARLRSNYKDRYWGVNHCISFGKIKIFPKQYKVLNGEAHIELSPTEFELLLYLSENRGKACTRKEMADAVRAIDNGGRNIDAHISKIRKKLEPKKGAPSIIKTIKKIGYLIE